MRRSDLLGPLADRQFRLLWLAATTSAVGSAFVPVALAFAVLGIGGNATSLGIVLLVGTIAGLASYQVAGVWADRLSRRSLMLTADLVRLAVEAAVAALLLTGHAKIWELAVAGAIVSIGTAFEGPASTSLVPEIIATEKLQQANSLLSICVSGSAVVGPALSGLMVAAVGPGWAFALDAASFAGSAAFLLAMAPTARPEAARQHFLADLAAGWREVASRSWAWSTLIGNALSNMAFAIFEVLGPVLALRRLGGASGWGVVSSGMTAGALLAGVVTMWYRARRPVSFGMAVSVLLALPAMALAAHQPLAVITASAVVGVCGGMILNNNWDTAIQQLVPNEVLARFRSYDYLLAFVAIPVGYAVAGPLQSAFGADRVLFGAGAVMVVANFVPAVLPSVRAVVRHKDGTITGPPLRGRRAAAAPVTQVPEDPASEPV
ncbi:MAG TPA: MFS transporter [Streptosporangiaceae bacterium]|nr:MFS transporter [Streptosporangiaceae bacterium]